MYCHRIHEYELMQSGAQTYLSVSNACFVLLNVPRSHVPRETVRVEFALNLDVFAGEHDELSSAFAGVRVARSGRRHDRQRNILKRQTCRTRGNYINLNN